MVTVRWLLIEDHAAGVLRALCAEVDAADPRLEHLGDPAVTAREGAERAAQLRPDVVLLDLRMPLQDGERADRQHGAWCALQIRSQAPATQVLLFTGDLPEPGVRTEHEIVNRLDAAGISGLVLKSQPSSEIAQAIHRVANGEAYFGPGAYRLWRACLQPVPHPCFTVLPDPLTSREHEVMVALATSGLTSERLARNLGVSAETVQSSIESACAKTNSANRSALIIWCLKNCPDVAPSVEAAARFPEER